jgi:adenylate cyclase
LPQLGLGPTIGRVEAVGDIEPPNLTFWQRAILRRLRRKANKAKGEPLSEEDWAVLWKMHASVPNRLVEKLWSVLPGSPRCGMCGAPFSGPGSMVVKPLGYRPSRKNPTLCATCVEASPPGGAKMRTGVMFADLRGFTSSSEGADPSHVSGLLRRFYGCAEGVLFPEAIIDKLIGDEVMALYLPYLELQSKRVPELMLAQARELLAAIGYGSSGGPFVEVGVGLDYGEAFVGNIGERDVFDFTAVGDVVNTAARLQGQAGPGEIVLSERVAAGIREPVGERVELRLAGKSEEEPAYRVAVARDMPQPVS